MRRVEKKGKRKRKRKRETSLVVRRAQQETFNSVTPGLNYHAETIVSGKIKKGVLSAAGGRHTGVSSSNK